MTARTSRPQLAALVSAAALLGLAMGPIPGGWKLPDGSKLVRKPPPGYQLDTARIINAGPDKILVTSKGSTQTKALVIDPTGTSVSFTLPIGGKNVVLRDLPGNALAAKGSLFWVATTQDPDDVGNGGGSGNQ